MSTRKFIKKLHLYVALTFCIPLILQGLSGAVLVFQKEISQALIKRNHKLAEGEIQSADSIIKAATAVAKEDFFPSFVKISNVAEVRFMKNDGDKKTFEEVIIDPVSLEVLEQNNPEENVFRMMKKFHETLMLKGELGHKIVSSFGFALLFLSITGIILWFPKTQNLRKPNAFTFKFKFSSVGKKFQRDLHVTFGFWLFFFLLITSFSGIYLSLTEGTSKAVLAIFKGEELMPINSIKVTKQNVKKITVDEAVDIAKSEIDGGMKLVAVGLSTKDDQPYRLNFISEDAFEGTPPTTVLVDPYNKNIIMRNPREYEIGNKINAWQHALHTGEWLGITSKITNFIVALSMLLFSITGVMMWLIKKRQPKVSA